MSENEQNEQEHVSIDEIVKSVYLDYTFFGVVMGRIKRVFTDDVNMPTACVTMQKQMIVNRKAWDSWNREGKKFVICHEIMHLANLHLVRFFDDFKSGNGKIANLATDCAINQLIPYTPPFQVITLDYIKEMVGDSTIRPKESAEYYYAILKNKQDEIEEQLKNDPEFQQMLDDINKGHQASFKGSLNESGNLNPLEISAIKNLINKAKQADMKSRQAGSGAGNFDIDLIPSYDVHIDKRIWKKAINKAIEKSPKAETYYVYNRPNRRNPDALYGKKHVIDAQKLYVILDSSASMGDDELSLCLGHLCKAIKTCDIVVELLVVDDGIQKVYKNVSQISKHKPFKIQGRGGTNLTHGLDYIKQKEAGKRCRLVVITDGYTDWRDEPNVHVTAIYTKEHTKLPGVKYHAVLDI
jgi:predicted metal-dependent peptidase